MHLCCLFGGQSYERKDNIIIIVSKIMSFAKNRLLSSKHHSLPKSLPQLLHPRNQSSTRKLQFPTRDDPNFSHGLGKRHYTITNATSLQKILNPQVSNRIKNYRSQTQTLKDAEKGKPKISIDFKLKPPEQRASKQRFISQGAEISQQKIKATRDFTIPLEHKISPNPKFVEQLMVKKMSPNLPQICSKTYEIRQKIPTQNIEFLKQKLRILNPDKEKKQSFCYKEKRLATDLNAESSQVLKPHRLPVQYQNQVQKVKYLNPTYLTTATYL